MDNGRTRTSRNHFLCPFADCGYKCGSVATLRAHFNDRHRDGSLETINNANLIATPYIRCPHCAVLCAGAIGLAQHKAKAPECRIAGRAVDGSLAPRLPQPSVTPNTIANNNLQSNVRSSTVPRPCIVTHAGLLHLVSLFRRSYDFPHNSWVNPMGRILITIFERWKLHHGSALQEAQHAAAILLLPGLLRAFCDSGGRPIHLLRELEEAVDPTFAILNHAANLVENETVDRIHRSPIMRSPRQEREHIRKLTGAGRLGAAMSALEKLRSDSDTTIEEPIALTEAEIKAELVRLNPPRNALDELAAPVAGAGGLL